MSSPKFVGTIKLFVCFFLAVDFKHALIPCYAKNDDSLSTLAAGSTNDNFTIAIAFDRSNPLLI